MRGRPETGLVAAGVLLALTPELALAYIDPNAGGLLFQILTPVFIAIVAFRAFLKHKTKALWSRMSALFRKPGA